MQRLAIIVIVVSIGIVSSAEAQDTSHENNHDWINSASAIGVPAPMRFLISLTPPIVGYSSIEGVIYNYTPIAFEVAIHDRMGLRFVPLALYYESDFQAYNLSVSAPLYFGRGKGRRPYSGLYAGPLIVGMVDRLPTRRSAVRGGFDVGYSWPIKSGMQFSLGYWQVFKALDFESGGAGLTISLGYWF